ncbi:MAG: glutathione S-transferase N-terminal domain-containing protein [Novosphingobium sp.]|nr:glutathione S-transferase N-terminal domain-containing protein [Novosphingobium sp.]
MTEPLTLYGMGSPNVRKVGLLLEELALDYRLVHVAVFKGEQFAPDFVALNPFAKVPVLVDPVLGVPLFESGAILFYLAEQHGAFLPPPGPARYEAMSWLMMQMGLMGPMLGQLNHFRIAQVEGGVDYARARYREQARRIYRTLDERLGSRDWVAGEAYSIADMAIHPWAHYLERHGFDPAAHPALLRWRSTIDARPGTERCNARFAAAFDQASSETRDAATIEDVDRFFARSDEMEGVDFSAVLGMR